jgi:hypothetical protein
MQAELERHEKVDAAAQNFGLVAGLALQSDQAAGDGAAGAPQFLDHRDAVVADVSDHARRAHKQRQDEHAKKRRADKRPERQ